MMKNAFYFNLKALFIFKFFSWLFGHVEKTTCWQISFVTLNRFWPLSKTPTPLLLRDNIKMDSIVKWGKKQTILTNLLFYAICQHLNIKIGFQAVKIYFLTFSSCFFTSYLQPIRNKLLKTLSVFYPTKWGKYDL